MVSHLSESCVSLAQTLQLRVLWHTKTCVIMDMIERVNLCAILFHLCRHLLYHSCSSLLHLLLSVMSRKRPREVSTSPKFQRVTWTKKQTRRGIVHSTEVITQAGSTETPKRPRKHIQSSQAKFTRDQTPRPAEAIEDAMSLPPILMPDLLVLQRERRGKV